MIITDKKMIDIRNVPVGTSSNGDALKLPQTKMINFYKKIYIFPKARERVLENFPYEIIGVSVLWALLNDGTYSLDIGGVLALANNKRNLTYTANPDAAVNVQQIAVEVYYKA